MSYTIEETDKIKTMVSPEVNYIFNKKTGFSAVWGNIIEEDPDWCPYGPLIADIEITTICKGPGGQLCPFCYKSNNPNGEYMTFELFKDIFDRLPNTLQQIAFGVDAQCESNPDTFKIMEYCRVNGVIPNVTVADISDETADELVRLCGAVAVSRYEDHDICYDTVKKLTDRGLDQVNIHCMISEETYHDADLTLHHIKNDPRLEKLNAIVFLSLKTKGRGSKFHSLDETKFKNLVTTCLHKEISFGFDSCSAVKFLDTVKDHPMYEELKMVSEPCESSRFSAYINTKGEYFPCSFMEGQPFVYGVPVIEYSDFMDVWNNDTNKIFRMKSMEAIDNGQGCQDFKI
jgi:hypothetical protein